MNKKFGYQVGNNKKVILWCTANQISRFTCKDRHFPSLAKIYADNTSIYSVLLAYAWAMPSNWIFDKCAHHEFGKSRVVGV